MAKEAYKIIAQNKKAYHDYFIDETYEAGMVLAGTEVKSLRLGKGSIKESFVRVIDGEIFVTNMHITPYEKGNIFNKDPMRTRKLLLNRYEINKIMGAVAVKGYTIMPLKIYLKKGRMKMEIGLARGKKLHDKRQDIAKKDQKRMAEKQFKVDNL
ncbi:tmRNA-binding protein [Petrocella atlantisensis]|uniref:SsrA-binding protein n=1 Tax=Petrocella atlantisensis TaxID=2173034 RepID=A0A3P7P1E3_9FIRM|nr:SsrA-binding protein SmpB [Petrocella atlantisensis]VDN48965.1 tmRNA-binding protein [Petrocella atlantisensis]